MIIEAPHIEDGSALAVSAMHGKRIWVYSHRQGGRTVLDVNEYTYNGSGWVRTGCIECASFAPAGWSDDGMRRTGGLQTGVYYAPSARLRQPCEEREVPEEVRTPIIEAYINASRS